MRYFYWKIAKFAQW